MSKVTKKELRQLCIDNEKAIARLESILKENGIERQPHLKQLDHSVFDGLDSKWKYAAVDKNGEAHLYTRHMTPDSDEFTYCEGFDFDYETIGTDYDATDWKNSLIKRESKPQLKQLDQSVFDGLDEKWRFAAVDSDGSRAVFTSDNITQAYGKHYVKACSGDAKQVLGRVDASNWQNSLIERHTAKELTGSELCKAMLKRGDKRIMCKVYDVDRQHDITHVIRAYRDGKFHTKANRWTYAIPINNQGEPLTAAEAGF